ncbi:hypothetical protein [Streptomyces sp. NPDC053427]|uniref:hypothetical protein n=1 Tax=Streptomyces sp. NPDC053427 TaxID=3365701 RepID=UPI0037CE30B4
MPRKRESREGVPPERRTRDFYRHGITSLFASSQGSGNFPDPSRVAEDDLIV